MDEFGQHRLDSMLALSSATEVDTLWQALREALAAHFTFDRVTLFLGHIGMRSARLVYTAPPIASPQKYFEARAAANPFSRYIEAHPGAPCYRFSDVLGDATAFQKTDFYRDFAEPEGWLYGLSGLSWLGDEVMGMYSMYRGPEHGDFSDDEMARLLELHPFIGVAIDRVRRLHREQQYRKVLEEFNRHLPVGLLLVNWEGELVYANDEAVRLCAEWNEGPGAAKQFNARSIFRIPERILELCRDLRESVLAGEISPETPAPANEPQVRQGNAGVQCTVRTVKLSGGNVARPGFLAILEGTSDVELHAPGSFNADRLILLNKLTASEREIALLVGEGLSNREIAERLGKSVLTIKTQVSSVFQKLNIRNRARLIALLR